MKKLLVGILLCTGIALAESAVPAKDFDWPTTPTRFLIVSVPIELEWKEGRPFAQRSDLVKYLHIEAEGSPTVDLIEALAEKGWQVRRERGGEIKAINPNGVSKGGSIDPNTREKNLKAPKYTAPKPVSTPAAGHPPAQPPPSSSGNSTSTMPGTPTKR